MSNFNQLEVVGRGSETQLQDLIHFNVIEIVGMIITTHILLIAYMSPLAYKSFFSYVFLCGANRFYAVFGYHYTVN